MLHWCLNGFGVSSGNLYCLHWVHQSVPSGASSGLGFWEWRMAGWSFEDMVGLETCPELKEGCGLVREQHWHFLSIRPVAREGKHLIVGLVEQTC